MGSGKKILIVDDDDDILMLVSFQFQKAGFQVLLAENGEEALKKFQTEKPHFVLLDWAMPQKDGLAVCQEIRKNNPLVYIIFLSARTTEEDKYAALEAGADDYLSKPFQAREVILRVRNMARRYDLMIAAAKNVAPAPVVPPKPAAVAAPLPPTPAITQPPSKPGTNPLNTVPQPPAPATRTGTNPLNAVPQPPAPEVRPGTNSLNTIPQPPATTSKTGTNPLNTSVPQPPPPRSNGSNPLPKIAPPQSVRESVQKVNLESLVQEASRAAQVQDIERARQLYLQVIQHDRYNEGALMWLAWYTTDPFEGVRYLERLVQTHPDNPRLREFLEAGRKRCNELNSLITGSNVLNYWNVVEQVHEERIKKGVDNRSIPVQPLGQLLLTKGIINNQQLETALSLHEMLNRVGTPKKLGEVLLEYGYLTAEQLKNVLNEQQSEYNSQFY